MEEENITTNQALWHLINNYDGCHRMVRDFLEHCATSEDIMAFYREVYEHYNGKTVTVTKSKNGWYYVGNMIAAARRDEMIQRAMNLLHRLIKGK